MLRQPELASIQALAKGYVKRWTVPVSRFGRMSMAMGAFYRELESRTGGIPQWRLGRTNRWVVGQKKGRHTGPGSEQRDGCAGYTPGAEMHAFETRLKKMGTIHGEINETKGSSCQGRDDD